MTITATAPIDPLGCQRPGVYSDALVEVCRNAVVPQGATRTSSRSEEHTSELQSH